MPVFTTAATAALMHQSDELPTVITATAEKKKKKKRSSSCLRMVSPATTIATCTSGRDRGQLVVPEDWGLAARDKMMMDDAAAVHPPKRSRRNDDDDNNNSFGNNINNDHNNKDHQHKDHQHSSKKQQKKKKQQHVTFASNVILNESPSIDSPLNRLETNDQWESLWYNAQEMATMKQQIHFLTRQLQAYLTQYQQQNINNNNNNSSTNHQNNNHHHLLYDSPKSPSLAVSDDTRGLEQRSCYERQRRKYLTHRYILHIAKTRCNNNNNMDATAMAKRATICSQWATQLAYIEAQRDYIRAYYECE